MENYLYINCQKIHNLFISEQFNKMAKVKFWFVAFNLIVASLPGKTNFPIYKFFLSNLKLSR